MLRITGLPFYTIVCLLRLSSLITDGAVVSGAAVDAPSLMVALPCYYNLHNTRFNSTTVISGDDRTPSTRTHHCLRLRYP